MFAWVRVFVAYWCFFNPHRIGLYNCECLCGVSIRGVRTREDAMDIFQHVDTEEGLTLTWERVETLPCSIFNLYLTHVNNKAVSERPCLMSAAFASTNITITKMMKDAPAVVGTLPVGLSFVAFELREFISLVRPIAEAVYLPIHMASNVYANCAGMGEMAGFDKSGHAERGIDQVEDGVLKKIIADAGPYGPFEWTKEPKKPEATFTTLSLKLTTISTKKLAEPLLLMTLHVSAGEILIESLLTRLPYRDSKRWQDMECRHLLSNMLRTDANKTLVAFELHEFISFVKRVPYAWSKRQIRVSGWGTWDDAIRRKPEFAGFDTKTGTAANIEQVRSNFADRAMVAEQ